VAKLKAPLLSFGARGAISKAVVFFPWKGIDAAREYVIPANPRTTAQKTQRGYLEDAVDEWHGANYTPDDRTAWNRFAGILADIMSGFNAYVRTFVNEAILGNVWTRMRNGLFDYITPTGFRANITKTSGGLAPHFVYGTSKTFMPLDITLADRGEDLWNRTFSGLTPDTIYYGYFYVGVSGATYGRTGIYQIRTLPA